MDVQSYRNGSPISNDCLLERAFVYSDGVFETMRCRRQSVPLWSFHKQRLERAQRQLNLSIDFPELESQLENILKKIENDDAIVKLIVGRAGQGRGSYAPDKSSGKASSVFYISVRHFDPTTRASSVRLKKVDRKLRDFGHFSGLKLLNRLDYVVATSDRQFGSDEEALFLDEGDSVIETMHHNIFAVFGSRLVTPDLSRCGVAGTMRQYLIQSIAKKQGVDVMETTMSFPELLKADGVFLTNAVDGIVTVSQVDGSVISENALISDLQRSIDELFA